MGIPAMKNALVLMATYNGGPWIETQLKSIFEQNDVQIKLVISDDCSKDNTREIINSNSQGKNLILITNEKPSGTAGANFRKLYRTVDTAGFDFVALADQDDIWHADKISCAIKKLEETGASGYSSAVTAFWEDGRRKKIQQTPKTTSADFLFEGAGQGCTFVVTADHFRFVQEYCKNNTEISESLHYHDWLIYLLARANGKSWFFDEKSSMAYRQHNGNEIGSRGGIKAALKRIELIKNGWYRNQIEAAATVYLSLSPDNKKAVALANLWRQRLQKNRIKKLHGVIMSGRRKLTDRLILALSSAAGWI